MWWIRWGRGIDWTVWFCGRDMGYFGGVWEVSLLLLLGNFSSWLRVHRWVVYWGVLLSKTPLNE